jgi:hypothetical protein
MKTALRVLFFGVFMIFAFTTQAAEPPVSEASSECLECHTITHPGIVESWQKKPACQDYPQTGHVS